MPRCRTDENPVVIDEPATPSSKRSLESFLRTGYLIHDVSRLRRQLYDQRSRHLGITRSQWWVLFNLARKAGSPMNQNDLAQMLEMGSASMGELLRRLEKSGFIKRQAVPGDRRSKHVVIADRGLEVLENMRFVARTSNEAIMAGISDQDQQLLNDLLSRMKTNLSAQVALLPELDESEVEHRQADTAARGRTPKRALRSRSKADAEAAAP